MSSFRQTYEEFSPFLPQTPASGPRAEYSPEPPYFRQVEIDENGNITTAEVLALRADGTPFSPKLSKQEIPKSAAFLTLPGQLSKLGMVSM